MKVAHECRGLPLGLVLIAQAMSDHQTREEWKMAVDNIVKQGVWGMLNDKGSSFHLLKYSYDHLENDTLRKCFLSCSLWPKGASIVIRDLINFWLGANVINDFEDIGAVFCMGHILIERLQRAGLLEKLPKKDFFPASMRMNNVIHYLAVWLVSECGVNCSRWVVGIQDREDIWQQAELIRALKEDALPPITPVCENLAVLYLDGRMLIPTEFFLNMLVLHYLDLGRLYWCANLPANVGGLASRQYLNLSNSRICKLPQELAGLIELKILILRCVLDLWSILFGLIGELHKLCWIYLTSYILWNEKNEALLIEFETPLWAKIKA